MSNTIGGTTGSTTGPTQITGSLGIETPVKIQNIINKDGKGQDVIIPLHTYIDDGKITINNTDRKIDTKVQDPIYTSTSVSLSEFVIGIAKDIFYSRDLSRQKSKTLAQDALYCAEIFTKILLSKNIISNKNGIVFYNDKYVPSATIKETQKLSVKVSNKKIKVRTTDKITLPVNKSVIIVEGAKGKISISIDEEQGTAPSGAKLTNIENNRATLVSGVCNNIENIGEYTGTVNIKIISAETSKYEEATTTASVTIEGQKS